MDESYPTVVAANFRETALDLNAVYYNCKAQLDAYNDSGLAAMVAALPNDTDLVPGMSGLAKADVLNGVATLGAVVTLLEAGHRTNCNKIVAAVPHAAS